MFDILENIAFYEANNKNQKGKKVKKQAKERPQAPKKVDKSPVVVAKRMNKEANSTFNFISRSKSIASKGGKDVPDLPFDDLMPENLNLGNKRVSKEVGDKHSSNMSFGDEEEHKHHIGDSPKGSVVSDHSFIDGGQMEEDDEFEDAQEGPVTMMLSDSEQMKQLKQAIITDCDEERIALPCLRDARLKGSAIWQILKDMVGKDITKYSMPVFVNEPLSNIQKYSEILCFNDLLQKASEQESSMMRLVYVSVYSAAKFYLIHNRLQKPFNSLLGETFEVVTPNYRALSE